ncbi:MAG: carboxypeptidase regulatory-like domain-containing protein [Planctomycetes bacterium]|nr:carboxypeptidase regulatory-like domain-containing protein [Planctomycetota bacterium]
MLPTRRLAAASLVGWLLCALGSDSNAQSPTPDAPTRLRGVIVERETERPIAGARIFDLPDSRSTLAALRELAVSAADGSFELAPDAATDTDCIVLAPGRAAGTFAPAELPTLPRIALGPAASFTMRVKTTEALRSELRVVVYAPRHRLDAQGRAAPRGGVGSWNLPLDSTGYARVDQLPAGIELTWRLVVFGEARTADREPFKAQVGAPVEREYELLARADLRGSLRTKRSRSRGELGGVAGHEIWLSRYVRSEIGERPTFEPRETVCTDSEGEFVFRDVEPGVWLVGTPSLAHLAATEPDSRELATPIEQVVTNFGEGRIDVIHLDTDVVGYLVSGRVLDPFGEPVARASLRVENRGRSGGELRSASDGSFLIGPIPARREDAEHAGERVFALSPSPEWTASAYAEVYGPTRGLELRLRRNATIRGTAVDELGQPIRGCSIRLQPFSRERYTSENVVWTVGDGRFSVEGVLPGRCWLFAGTRDRELMGLSQPLDIAAGETREDVRLVLSPVAEITLGPELFRSVRDSFSIEVDGVGVASGNIQTAPGGFGSQTERVPPGHVRVLLSRGDPFGSPRHTTLIAEFDLGPREHRTVERAER